ncbi:MAG TPA: PEMT/PEM2 methyltransferase family protein [Gemmatimonadales bacterium]|nr:PEMT/PEM2 methyltransferase family protein [Gemmatimonadales bacterium]
MIALAYHFASRLAYVLYIGLTLAREDRSAYLTARHGAEQAFRRFRRVAATLMLNDAASFVLLCVVTRNTLRLPVPPAVTIAVGAVLVLVGIAVKVWATATLGAGAYYWRDFFVTIERPVPATAGPYPFLKNPMYSVGYLPTYGLALVTASLPALIASAIDQGAILAFYRWVEKPHFKKMLTS